MKTRIMLIPLILILVLAVLAISCAQPAPAPAPTPAPKPAPAPAPKPAPAPITITMGDPWNEYFNPMHEAWTQEVVDATNGAVNFEYFWAGSMYGAREGREMILSGAIDMGALHPVYYPDQIMAFWNWTVPFNTDDTHIMTKVFQGLYKEFPEYQEEITQFNFHVFGEMTSPPYEFNAKFPFTKIEDLKGRKIMGLGKYEPLWIEAAGATPVSIPSPERFTALQSGMVDGGTGQIAYFMSYKFHDAGSKHISMIGMGCRTGNGFWVMNKDKWNTLPGNVQEAMTDRWENFRNVTLPTVTAEKLAGWIQEAKDLGFEFTTLPVEERAKWAKLIEPHIQDYADAIDEAKGKPGLGVKFVKRIQSLQKELGANIFYEFDVK